MPEGRSSAVPTTMPASGARIVRCLSLCRNCDAVLAGRYCAACGQVEAGRDRVQDIAREWLTAIIRPDHIMWRTIIDLTVRPARLTQDWWAGKRVAQMSPVRTLVSLLIVGAILAWIRQMTLPGLPNDIALNVQIFAYQNSLVNVLLLPHILRRLAPRDTGMTAYHHVSFALYESAFMTLLYGSLMTSLFLLRLASDLVGDWILWGVYGLGLGACVAFFTHFVVHLKSAYAFWGIRGALKCALTIGSVVAVSVAVTMTLAITGIDRLWDEPREHSSARGWGWRVEAIQ